MHRHIGIGLTVTGALTVAGAYLAVFANVDAAGPWLLALGTTLLLAGLGVLGAGAGRPRLATVVVVACALTLAGFGSALLAAPPTADGPLWLGLPRATTLLLLLSGLGPLLLLPIAYALCFEREEMRDG